MLLLVVIEALRRDLGGFVKVGRPVRVVLEV
jgi:hypothetical protein